MFLRTVSGRGGQIALSVIVVLAASGERSLGAVIAYQVPAGVVGNQSDATTRSFGMDFDVNSPIKISSIGVFDSSQNGLQAPIEAAIFNRDTQALATPVVTFAAGQGTGAKTIGGSQFLPIELMVSSGFHGSIVTFGYGDGSSGELDGNSFGAATGTPTFPWTVNDGGALVSFVGAGRFSNPGGGAMSYPLNIDTGPANRYAAGTFIFEAVPEPGGLALSILAASIAAATARRRAHRSRTDGLPASS